MYQLLSGIEASKYFRKKMFDDVVRPKISIILVGDDVPSQIYVKNKLKVAAEVGIEAQLYKFDVSVSEKILLDLIHKLNEDESINGMIVQLPLPKHLDRNKIINSIDVRKDIDGLHQQNYGNLILNENIDEMLIPATPLGISLLLQYYGIDLSGKDCVILGRGVTVGTPLNILLSKKIFNATCTLCHTKTKNLQEHTLRADILISATGAPFSVTADMVKEKAVVVDVGISRIADA
ncbi:MAG: bifunctional 5,10-methylenetetrahydrofolate dehydrogenase/5,10-methenyltetrahydrofolate cyclohydrolase, partial [Cytophagales bacterium]|nr:bifunctional 5,10-methylenetetrahydrofolate dehydrogenase/5,10-methenyltetrahydrofolate cyclohydrolase [Cytophagales bacterium]